MNRHAGRGTAGLAGQDRAAAAGSEASPKGGRLRVSDEMALNGILFVLRTGIAWEDLPRELGFGSGMICWRRLREWQACRGVEPHASAAVDRVAQRRPA